MFLKEFKDFISKGNVIDLAVAVVMGAAFTGIVQSIVKDIITPILGVIMGGVDLSGLSVTIGKAVIKYGSFIQAVINFLLISLVIFIIIKAINKFQKHLFNMEVTGQAPASAEVKALREIRDLLKHKQEGSI